MSNLLEIKNLSITFNAKSDAVNAVDGIALHIKKGETLGIVGESGSGKSVTALSIMRLLPKQPGLTQQGEILFQPNSSEPAVDLLRLSDPEMQKIRGKAIAMIFQEPMTSLNPVFSCGDQVAEAIQLHQKMSYRQAKDSALSAFERVKLPDPKRIFQAFPHQISGGQKQRVMIAMAISCNPALLLADEPTTALDVTVQKAILELLQELKADFGLSMMFISHDLGVISEICDRVAVMYQGKIVEEGLVDQILQAPEHPYTRGLVACRPSIHRKLWRMPTVADFMENAAFDAQVVSSTESEKRNTLLYAQVPLLQVHNLEVRFPAAKNWLGATTNWVHAVNKVSFDVFSGETFGLAGESGCGKTTLARAITRLTDVHDGEILYQGTDLLRLNDEELRPFRREIQIVFQDPYSSLNPRMTVGEAIMEPMTVHHLYDNAGDRRDKTMELLKIVGLEPPHFHRLPREFSGGQRQRICIARALSLQPRFLVCDEIVSSLDVSVQATILNLLMDLQEQFGLTYLFVSHDLSVIKQMCDRLMIMNDGNIETLGFTDEIYRNPSTDYVKRLLNAVPGA
jgi:peptide/nickel transport system ATP-binding protein